MSYVCVYTEKSCETQHLQGCYHQAIMMYTTFEDLLHPKGEKAATTKVTPELLAENDKVTTYLCRQL